MQIQTPIGVSSDRCKQVIPGPPTPRAVSSNLSSPLHGNGRSRDVVFNFHLKVIQTQRQPVNRIRVQTIQTQCLDVLIHQIWVAPQSSTPLTSLSNGSYKFASGIPVDIQAASSDEASLSRSFLTNTPTPLTGSEFVQGSFTALNSFC